jgi:hypothetical protein
MHRQIKRFTDMGGLSLFEGAFILVFRDTAGALDFSFGIYNESFNLFLFCHVSD